MSDKIGMPAGYIVWTRTKLKKFEKAYCAASVEGKDSFVFEGHTILTSYAKYLIEYLRTEFAKDGNGGGK